MMQVMVIVKANSKGVSCELGCKLNPMRLNQYKQAYGKEKTATAADKSGEIDSRKRALVGNLRMSDGQGVNEERWRVANHCHPQAQGR